MKQRVDIAIIGGGPAGAAAAIRAARGGATVLLCEKAAHGRDKVCGDGLTPRAVRALHELGIELDGAHRIDGLRMLIGHSQRQIAWPVGGTFPAHGAVWRRAQLDAALIDAAVTAGVDVRFNTSAEPVLDASGRVAGIALATAGTTATVHTERVNASLVIAATGAPGSVARLLGATKVADEPHGLAIRTYVESPQHDDRYLEACLTMNDEHGAAIPGYGWMFPCGDGTVNLGVGALSTMRGFSGLNLNTLVEHYRHTVAERWGLGEFADRPRAWRLPMSVQRRHGPGWLAVGDAAGLVNPMNGEGIDYGLESGICAADHFLAHPATCASDYDRAISDRYDRFLTMGRRFAFLIGHPRILRAGVRVGLGSDSLARITVQVMGNLVDDTTTGAAKHAMSSADHALRLADPLLRRFRARS